MIAGYLTALLMGLTGSLHCAGMCGPIMLFMPFHQLKGIKKIAGISLYHFSRISAYALMAFFLFSFRDLFNPGVQRFVSVGLGALLLVVGLLSFFPLKERWQIKLPWSAFVRQKLTYFIGNPSLMAVSISGFLNGLLPCGLVYLALSTTLALQSPLQAVAFTYIFGLGTLPVLVSIILFRSRITIRKRALVQRFTPVVVFFFGCIFVLRGLNLGIPYLSPATQVSNGVIHSCCHKK